MTLRIVAYLVMCLLGQVFCLFPKLTAKWTLKSIWKLKITRSETIFVLLCSNYFQLLLILSYHICKKPCICFHFSPVTLMEKNLTGIIPSASFYVQDPRLLEIFPTLIHYDGKVNLTGFFLWSLATHETIFSQQIKKNSEKC